RVEAVRRYMKARRRRIADVNEATQFKLRCERKLGEMLAAMEKDPGGRPRGNPSHDARSLRRTLRDLGITYSQSSRWQRLASVPAGLFEAHCRRATADGIELTAASVQRLAERVVIEPKPGGHPFTDLGVART